MNCIFVWSIWPFEFFLKSFYTFYKALLISMVLVLVVFDCIAFYFVYNTLFSRSHSFLFVFFVLKLFDSFCKARMAY